MRCSLLSLGVASRVLSSNDHLIPSPRNTLFVQVKVGGAIAPTPSNACHSHLSAAKVKESSTQRITGSSFYSAARRSYELRSARRGTYASSIINNKQLSPRTLSSSFSFPIILRPIGVIQTSLLTVGLRDLCSWPSNTMSTHAFMSG